MSHKLPVVSGRDFIKAFMKLGYYIRSQESSHIHLRHPVRPPLTIPNHKEIARCGRPREWSQLWPGWFLQEHDDAAG